jgi:hypothetical protein
MSRAYLIKPLEKKRIQWCVEMYRQNDDGSISWFNITETYRWGQGIIEENKDCNLPYQGDDIVYCKNDCRWDSELEDSIHIGWEFGNDLSELDQQELKESYYDGGAGWLFDGEHNWRVEDDYIVVYAPYQISLCEENGTVIEEKVKLKKRPEPITDWPFAMPKDSTQGG